MNKLAATLVLAFAACSPPAEDACTLSFERIVALDPPPGDEGFAGYVLVSPELPGRLRAVVTPEQGEFPVLFYDARGRFVDTLGGIGSGPGEYRRPQHVLPYRGDSILIVDRVNGRATVLDTDFRVGRSFPLTFPVFLGSALDDGSLVLAHGVGVGSRRTARFEPDGRARDSVPWYEGGEPPEPFPLVLPGAGPAGTWWSLTLWQRFEFRRYDARDSLLTAWEFPETLLAPYVKLEPATPTRPPTPTIWSASLDGADRLWTFAVIADSQWAEGLGDPQAGEGGETYYPREDRDAVYDGLVIVSRAATGEVLASWRLDSVPGIPIEPGVVMHQTEDADGWTRVELRRPVPSPACGLD